MVGWVPAGICYNELREKTLPQIGSRAGNKKPTPYLRSIVIPKIRLC